MRYEKRLISGIWTSSRSSSLSWGVKLSQEVAVLFLCTWSHIGLHPPKKPMLPSRIFRANVLKTPLLQRFNGVVIKGLEIPPEAAKPLLMHFTKLNYRNPNGVNHRIIKLVASIITPPITTFFTFSLTCGAVPND